MVIGLGLGAFYALARTTEPLRLAINPCMRPSLELSQIYPDIQQKESVLADFSEQEVMMYTLSLLGPASKDYFSSTFGIFSKEDKFRPEIDFFASVYSPRSKRNANIEWISDEGHELTKLQLESALKSAFDFFRIEKEAVCDDSLRRIGKLKPKRKRK